MKMITILILAIVIAGQSLLASERIDAMINEDAMTTLQEIANKKNEIQETKDSLEKMQKSLKAAKNGQQTYIKIRNIAGTLAIVAIAIGAYKTSFPSGLKFTGLKLMFSSYIAVTGLGQGMIKLNQGDIENLSREIIMSLIKISKLEKGINRQVKVLCKEDPRHELCYTCVP